MIPILSLPNIENFVDYPSRSNTASSSFSLLPLPHSSSSHPQIWCWILFSSHSNCVLLFFVVIDSFMLVVVQRKNRDEAPGATTLPATTIASHCTTRDEEYIGLVCIFYCDSCFAI